MAYSCVRVHFEIGHEASIRNKRTPDGFTHDWEVFVRGADNAEIHNFVDKVVFHLHDTFPKPKRTVKDPPYVVKESGYAGFPLPIDIYLKSKEEGCRKIRFYYDLTLQPVGSESERISNVVREKFDIFNPIEDFRRKLIKGGGVGVGVDGNATNKISSSNVSNSVNSNANHLDESKNSPHSSSSKHKSSSGAEPPAKKHKAAKEPKTEESRLTNSFADLFGTPIKTIKHSPNAKPPTKSASDSKTHDKSKESSAKLKPSPAKEKSEREKERNDRKDREIDSKSSNKEKERSSGKEKDGHKSEEKSKSRKSGSSSSSSTTTLSQKDFIKKEEDRPKKVLEEVSGSKDREKPAAKSESAANIKTEKKHEEKKSREDKEKKEKHKKESHEKKEAKELEKEKVVEKPRHEPPKELVKEAPKDVASGKHKGDREEKERKSKSSEKLKDKSSSETEKPKHKHKKKDKHKRDEEREKSKKKEKEKEAASSHENKSSRSSAMPPPLPVMKVKSPPPSPPPPPPVKTVNPLNKLIAELSDKETDSDFSGSEDNVKVETKERSPSPAPPPPPPPPAPPKVKEEKRAETPKEERPEKSKKKDKKSKDDEYRKRKRKHKDRDSSKEPQEKIVKPAVDAVKEEKCSPSPSRLSVDRSRSPSPESTLFTEDYINQLKDLQHKIMTLQDNNDLQKVVQVISETGQFEITQRTFDFDLCALDPSTVKMLQDMFISV